MGASHLLCRQEPINGNDSRVLICACARARVPLIAHCIPTFNKGLGRSLRIVQIASFEEMNPSPGRSHKISKFTEFGYVSLRSN